MQTTLLETIQREAENNGLQIVTVTGGTNGYPAPELGKAVIGFTTFEACSEFAENYGAEIVELYQKNGWHNWENKGRIYGPFDLDFQFGKMHDDFTFVKSLDDIDYKREEVDNYLCNGEFSEAISKVQEMQEIAEKIEECPNNEVVVLNSGTYWDTIPNECVNFQYDSQNWIIGVYFPYSE